MAGQKAYGTNQARPRTIEAYEALDAPRVRERRPNGPCRMYGKLIRHTPTSYVVAVVSGDTLTDRRVRVTDDHHTEPCERCPDATKLGVAS